MLRTLATVKIMRKTMKSELEIKLKILELEKILVCLEEGVLDTGYNTTTSWGIKRAIEELKWVLSEEYK